jgi:hypothetical protein
MLKLVGYDLEKDPLHPLNYAETLGAALEACGTHPGDAINVQYGPRFVDTELSPHTVVETILQHLGPHRDDKILVLPVHQGGNWAARGVDPEKVAWLAHGDRLRQPASPSLLALAYSLHKAKAQDYDHLVDDLKALAIFRRDGYCHPLHALSFLATDRAPWALRDELTKSLEDRAGRKRIDELLIIPVESTGAAHGLAAEDLRWFRNQGVHLEDIAAAA